MQVHSEEESEEDEVDGTVIALANVVALGLRNRLQGLNASERCTSASVGVCHTVLIKDTGGAVAFGMNDFGQCDVPELAAGECYTSASAGGYHTVSLCGKSWQRHQALHVSAEMAGQHN